MSPRGGKRADMYSNNEIRKSVSDQWFAGNEANARYDNHLFVRLSAKGKTFTNVDFRYTTFDACYFRDAKFDSCDFTGCRFVATNLHGAKFLGCRFEYASFERTLVDPAILDTECPSLENLRIRFARSLRMNYQQLGDAVAVNKAMKVELEATETHLFKSWASEEEYYRRKYVGLLWWSAVYRWALFRLGDFVWGNGESALRLLRFVLLILICMTVYDVFSFGDAHQVGSYGIAFLRSGEVFMGVPAPAEYLKPYVAAVTLIRLIAIGFLLSIIIKKFNRR
jgi:hypothetical protein